MIQIRGLAKSFGNLRIVENVSFVARDGEITGLIGPNGAGKTTWTCFGKVESSQ